MEAAKWLFRVPLHVLDAGLGYVIRCNFTSWLDMYTAEGFRDFLWAMFTRAVTTSTFVERLFRDLSGWTRTRQSLPTLAAKYLNAALKRSHRRWKLQIGENCMPNTDRSRPDWTKQVVPNGHTTGLHVFQRAMRRQAESNGLSGFDRISWSLQQWDSLGEEQQRKYVHQALGERVIARTVQHSPLERHLARLTTYHPPSGLWNMADVSSEYPLHRDHIDMSLQARGAWGRLVKQWKALHNRRPAMSTTMPPAALLPSKSVMQEPCDPLRFQDVSAEDMPSLKEKMRDLLDEVRCCVRAHYTDASPTVCCMFVRGSGATLERRFAEVVNFGGGNPWYADIMLMDAVPDDDRAKELKPPFSLRCRSLIHITKDNERILWPLMLDEEQWAYDMVQYAEDWTLWELSSEPFSFSQVRVLAWAPMDSTEHKRQQAADDATKRVMREFRKLQKQEAKDLRREAVGKQKHVRATCAKKRRLPDDLLSSSSGDSRGDSSGADSGGEIASDESACPWEEAARICRDAAAAAADAGGESSSDGDGDGGGHGAPSATRRRGDSQLGPRRPPPFFNVTDEHGVIARIYQS